MELVCVVCNTYYNDTRMWRLGGQCGDLSQHQIKPCTGRLMRYKDWQIAEFREPRPKGGLNHGSAGDPPRS